MSTYQDILEVLRKENAEHEERAEALGYAANAIFLRVLQKIGAPEDMTNYDLGVLELMQGSGMPRRDMDITVRFPGVGSKDLFTYKTTVFLEHNGSGVMASLQSEQAMFEIVQGGPGLGAIALAVDRGLRAAISQRK